MSECRVAVTGIGIVCASGNDRDEVWRNVCAGRSGFSEIESIETLWMGPRLGGEVRGLDVEARIGTDGASMERATQFAVVAALEALEQSGITIDGSLSERVGVALGVCQGALSQTQEGAEWKPRVMDFMHASCDGLATFVKARGPRVVVSTACSAGSTAIGFAYDHLRSGDADVMIAGGTDSLAFFSLAGFNSVLALDGDACAPYSRSGGLTLGEGAAILVLEPLERALDRGAHVIAELRGYGLSADAYHATAPDPSGRGAALAVTRALTQAGVSPDDVDYINGHGTGTPANDAMERHAVKAVFGERAHRIPMSSTKSITGHTLGAAGAIEAAFTVLAIRDDRVPPTINFDPAADQSFDFVPNESRAAGVDVAISNNYAFGGNNACLVFSKPPAPASEPSPARPETAASETAATRSFSFQAGSRAADAGPDADVVVTGIGAIGSLGEGLDEWWDALSVGKCGIARTGWDLDGHDPLAGVPPTIRARGLAPTSTWRRMDALSRQTLAAARLAWRDASLDLNSAELENVGLIFATNAGAIDAIEGFDEGARAGTPNPFLFMNTTLNAPAGHLCTVLGLRGPTATITTGGVSGILALLYARNLIRRGRISTAVVVSGDLLTEKAVSAAMSRPGLVTDDCVRPFDRNASGTAISGSSIAIVLEAGARAAERGKAPRCVLRGGGSMGAEYQLGDLSQADDWARALGAVLTRCGVGPSDVQYCAAAAAGIPEADRLEAATLSRLFGEAPAVSAPKSIAGETLSGSGLVNLVAGTLALERGVVPPTLNLHDPWDSPLSHVMGTAERRDVENVLVNSASVGGTIAAVVAGRPS